LAELAFVATLAMFHEEWQQHVKNRLKSQMKKYNHAQPSRYERAIDYVQSKVRE
jgi:hypothetical protein